MTIAKLFNRYILFSFAVLMFLNPGISVQGQNIWLADSHLITNGQNQDKVAQLLQFQKLTASNQWQACGMDEIWAEASDRTTTYIYLHGNDTDKNAAVEDGWLIAGKLRAAHPDNNFRLIIWYWDSRRTTKPLRQDILMKKYRSDYVSFPLAWFVEQASAHTPVGMIGYSFGANSVLGASHLLGGGHIHGISLAGKNDSASVDLKQPVSVLLIAPAVPSSAFLGGLDSRNLALNALTSVYLTVNLSDPALRWYHLLFLGSGCKPQAMGFVGVDGVPVSESGKTHVYSMEELTGASHKLSRYIGCNTIVQQFSGVITAKESVDKEAAF